ncbi:hypothetical protein HYH02_004257 [Chlamydomonas schloesseri]|uniref:Uncharacterized protein n=1 Tax=Chlamydomonas schloesseri TaxID=2026947 RepID=A0A835WNY6_9CHLO|nr:hypothetical protein HYH02_004257 [Chlamydomonas schloesseri]|eukprot:KAG2450985.1 hypothetical protein HYH02_004257 [Chlamydomonas schloesseri]
MTSRWRSTFKVGRRALRTALLYAGALLALVLALVAWLLGPHLLTALHGCAEVQRLHERPPAEYTRISFTPRSRCEAPTLPPGSLHVVLSYADGEPGYLAWLPLLGLTGAHVHAYHRVEPCGPCARPQPFIAPAASSLASDSRHRRLRRQQQQMQQQEHMRRRMRSAGSGNGSGGSPTDSSSSSSSGGHGDDGQEGNAHGERDAHGERAGGGDGEGGDDGDEMCGMSVFAHLLLPHHGREAAAYLHHVLTHYNNLPSALLFIHGHGPYSWHMLPQPTVQRARAVYRGLSGDPWFAPLADQAVGLSAGCHRSTSAPTCCKAYLCDLSGESSAACPLQDEPPLHANHDPGGVQQQGPSPPSQRSGPAGGGGPALLPAALRPRLRCSLKPGIDPGLVADWAALQRTYQLDLSALAHKVQKEVGDRSKALVDGCLPAPSANGSGSGSTAEREAAARAAVEVACSGALSGAALAPAEAAPWSCCSSLVVPRWRVLLQARSTYAALLAAVADPTLDDQLTGRLCLEFVAYRLFTPPHSTTPPGKSDSGSSAVGVGSGNGSVLLAAAGGSGGVPSGWHEASTASSSGGSTQVGSGGDGISGRSGAEANARVGAGLRLAELYLRADALEV